MLRIIDKRKKSIKSRLIIDFGIILVGICIFNYFLVSFIYQDILNKKEVAKTEIVANAAITQAQLTMKNANEIMSNITKIRILEDEQLPLEEKIKELEDYVSPFYDIGIIGLDGQGISVQGESFNVKGDDIFENALKGEFVNFDVMQYEGTSYLVFLRPIKSAEGQMHSIAIGVCLVEDFFNQIMEVSSGEVCFIANRFGAGLMGIRIGDDVDNIRLLDNDPGIKQLFEKEILLGKEYTFEIKDEYSNGLFDFSYELLGDSEWLLGIIHNRSQITADLKGFRTAMVTGMIIAISIGVIIVYFIAGSIAKRMRHIASYLGSTIKNEFKDSVPMELLEDEDEIGIIAREMKHLEEEMAEMLTSIKESINYLNDKIAISKEKSEEDSNKDI